VARIFAGDQVNRFQSFDGAKSNVLQISDWRSDKKKRSGHRLERYNEWAKIKKPEFKKTQARFGAAYLCRAGFFKPR
jgi:hypothetical protein